MKKDIYRLENGKLYKYESPTVPGTAGGYHFCFAPTPGCDTIAKAIMAYEAHESHKSNNETMTPEAVAYRKREAKKKRAADRADSEAEFRMETMEYETSFEGE